MIFRIILYYTISYCTLLHYTTVQLYHVICLWKMQMLHAKDLDLLLPGMSAMSGGEVLPQLTPRTVAKIVEGRTESKESEAPP